MAELGINKRVWVKWFSVEHPTLQMMVEIHGDPRLQFAWITDGPRNDLPLAVGTFWYIEADNSVVGWAGESTLIPIDDDDELIPDEEPVSTPVEEHIE